VACQTSALAGDGALVDGRLGELPQLTEGRCAGLMQGGTEGHLQRLQIQLASLPALGEDRASSILTSRATSAWIAARGG
jgi:hypothetical protein